MQVGDGWAELTIDLRPEARCCSVGQLLGLHPAQLQDAWMLLRARE